MASLVITAGCALDTGAAATPSSPNANTEAGVVRGAAVTGGYQFLGIPYAAAPTGNLRWRPPQPAAVVDRGPRRLPVRAVLSAA